MRLVEYYTSTIVKKRTPLMLDVLPVVSSHMETVVVLGRQRIDSHISVDLEAKKRVIRERKNYNVGSGKRPMPLCPPEKEEAIKDAFRHFKMI